MDGQVSLMRQARISPTLLMLQGVPKKIVNSDFFTPGH